MSWTLSPTPKFIALDATGVTYPLAAVYTYAAGTLTPIDTASDSSGSLNANPVVCDSAGRATIYLTAGLSYKFILKDTVGGSTVWTQDNIQATPAASVDLTIDGLAGEDIAAGQGVYLSDGSGGKVAGSWYLWDADQTYSSVTAGSLAMAQNAIAMSATGSLKLSGRITGLSGLTAGTQYYISATAGGLTSSAPANTRAVGVADSTTSLIFSPWVPATYATATVPGIVSITTQAFGGAKEFTGAVDCDTTLNVDGAATMLSTLAVTGAITQAGVRLNSRVYADSVAHTSATTGEETLSTTTLTAGLLAADGQALRVIAWGKYAATANQKKLRIYFGGTIIFEYATNASAHTFRASATIMRTGASAEVSEASLFEGNSAVNTAAPGGVTATVANAFDNLAIATSGAIIIKTTTTDAVAAAGTTQEGFLIEGIGV